MPDKIGWLVYALGSAFFAALTAILAKVGVAEVKSNLATFLRTLVIVPLLAAFVTWTGEWQPLDRISRRGALFLILSGLATGLSWVCYYKALSLGPASAVAPVDKLSVALAIVLAIVFLREPLTGQVALGGAFIVIGVLVLALGPR